MRWFRLRPFGTGELFAKSIIQQPTFSVSKTIKILLPTTSWELKNVEFSMAFLIDLSRSMSCARTRLLWIPKKSMKVVVTSSTVRTFLKFFSRAPSSLWKRKNLWKIWWKTHFYVLKQLKIASNGRKPLKMLWWPRKPDEEKTSPRCQKAAS